MESSIVLIGLWTINANHRLPIHSEGYITPNFDSYFPLVTLQGDQCSGDSNPGPSVWLAATCGSQGLASINVRLLNAWESNELFTCKNSAEWQKFIKHTRKTYMFVEFVHYSFKEGEAQIITVGDFVTVDVSLAFADFINHGAYIGTLGLME